MTGTIHVLPLSETPPYDPSFYDRDKGICSIRPAYPRFPDQHRQVVHPVVLANAARIDDEPDPSRCGVLEEAEPRAGGAHYIKRLSVEHVRYDRFG